MEFEGLRLTECHLSFSPASIEANVQRTNARNYGRYPVFTNVFSTHGQLDPWRAVGVERAPNEGSPVTIIPSEINMKNSKS
jgi:Serine carboxypeptidase S28